MNQATAKPRGDENPLSYMVAFILLFVTIVCVVGLIIMAGDNYLSLEAFARFGLWALAAAGIGGIVGVLAYAGVMAERYPQYKQGGGRIT